MYQTDAPAQLAEMVRQLNRNQLRHVAEMLTGLTRAEAATAQGIKPDAVYHWPAAVAQAADLIRLKPEEAARQVFRLALLKAALVKVAALDSDNEATRQKAATEIIEGVLGRQFTRPEAPREEWLAELAADAEDYRQQLMSRFIKTR